MSLRLYLTALFVSFLAALTTPSASHAQTLQVGFAEVVRGGITADAWGETSTTTTFARGQFHIQIPRGGRVRWARLYSGFTVFYPNTMRPSWPPSIPRGPSGSPRTVTVGSGSTMASHVLEGTPRYFSSTVPTTNVTAHWGTFITDVTSAVRSAVGPSSRGGITEVPVAERGDDAPREGPGLIQFGGHFLVVVYDLDFGPRRNLAVYEGCATSGFESSSLPLPGPVANRCPTGFPRGEPFAASVGVMWEFNRRPNPAAPNDPSRDTCSEEESTLIVNGHTLTTRAGGADDWPSVPAGAGCYGNTAGLCTMGTFGGNDPGAFRAAGSPAGLDGDNILGAPALPRLDDELYDFRTVIADNATSMQFHFRGDNDEMLPVVAFQTLARGSRTDADDDSWSDSAEGDCAVDTDADGTPDYLDTDSDNDCLPDSRETESGRTDPRSPGRANANCPSNAPVCDTTAGVCLCNANSDCSAAPGAPLCDPATRVCVGCTTDAQCAALDPTHPACATTGPSAGRCVACETASHCTNPAQPRCDPTTNTCVSCRTNSDCSGSTPICDASTHTCRPCNPSASPTDCTDTSAPICATTGPSTGRCVQCARDTDCPMGTCDTASSRCTGCQSNADCGGDAPICDLSTRRCRPCDPAHPDDCRTPFSACATSGSRAGHCVTCTATNAMACPASTPVCDPGEYRCVRCTPGPMGDATACRSAPDGIACITTVDGSYACGCAIDSDCGSPTSGRICDARLRRCRDGCWPGDNHNGCPDGMACSSDDPTTPGVCSAGCFRDADCVGSLRRCLRSGDTAGRCVGCLGDADCAGRKDHLTHCDTNQNVCTSSGGGGGGGGELDGGITTPLALRGGGCACRTNPYGNSPSAAWLFAAGVVIAFTERTRRNRRNRHGRTTKRLQRH